MALSGDAKWAGGFRDLNAAVVRMATLAPGGRISEAVVEEETRRLKDSWEALETADTQDLLSEILTQQQIDEIDLFDRVQLAQVIEVCRESRSLSDAGRRLFNASRARKASTNDADRLRKYLSRFGIDWSQLTRN
jgi:transcriptional regulatory protein RtcR